LAHSRRCKLPLSTEVKVIVSKTAETLDLNQFYGLFELGRAYSLFKPAEVQAICKNILHFLEPDGSARVNKKTAKVTSYEGSGYVLDIVGYCAENKAL